MKKGNFGRRSARIPILLMETKRKGEGERTGKAFEGRTKGNYLKTDVLSLPDFLPPLFCCICSSYAHRTGRRMDSLEEKVKDGRRKKKRERTSSQPERRKNVKTDGPSV